MTFGGVTFNEDRDGSRLRVQLAKVKACLLTGNWWTLEQLAAECEAPEASVSARLRDLRKPKFGGYEIERQYVTRGLWRYRMLLQ